MKKLLFIIPVALMACKKDCNCVQVQEHGKPAQFKGETVMNYEITDTIQFTYDCSENGQITQIESTLRNRIICE